MTTNKPKFGGIKRGNVAAKAAAADIALGVDRAQASEVKRTQGMPETQAQQKNPGGRPRLPAGRRHVKVTITMPGSELGRLDALVERQKSRGSRADHAGMLIRCGLEALSKMDDDEIQQLAADLMTGKQF